MVKNPLLILAFSFVSFALAGLIGDMGILGRWITMTDVDVIAAGLTLGMVILALTLLVLGFRFPAIEGPRWWAAGAGMMVAVALAWHWGGTGQLPRPTRSPLFIASLLIQACGLVRFGGGTDGRKLALIAMLGMTVAACRQILPHGSDIRMLIVSAGLVGAMALVARQAWQLGVERDMPVARLAALLATAGTCILAVCLSMALIGAPLVKVLYELQITALIVMSLQVVFLLWLGCLVVLVLQAATSRDWAETTLADRSEVPGGRRRQPRCGRSRAAINACICPSPRHCRRPACRAMWQERRLNPGRILLSGWEHPRG